MASPKTDAVVAMREDGEYNRHSDLQLRLIRMGLEHGIDTPKTLETADGKPILTIADYGCSQGLNSALSIQQILTKQPPGTGARIFLLDTPYNDWNSVSQTFHAQEAAISENGARRIFTEMVPGSFFEQCLPDAAVDIGTTWSSIHWLSEYSPLPAGTTFDEIIRQFYHHGNRVAHSDLVRFLNSRAREIRPEGTLIAGFARQGFDDAGRPCLNMQGINTSAVLAREELITEGRLPEETATIVPPLHDRTHVEVEAALQATKEFWAVEELVPHTMAHPAYERLQVELKAGSSEAAYRKYTRTLATWWMAAPGTLMFGPKTSTAKETAEEKMLIEDYTQKIARHLFEKFKDDPEVIRFWYMRLRRK
ncbi:S-adenosyl-L-methionine-dependent methyltransferase [Macrophomina phaseolina]|uniref:S-adenosyl-L-methionine-dependent methyltransferase n=1 Tax=Macrophomina phaseolina TaxID=35725 RepID=A0ABQ8G305_9PEZI|nr:S-adenosyl-L-methionine-dependent methyltransferase [Macrophomina phaseolina]